MASEPLTLADMFGDPPYDDVVEDVYGDGVQLLIEHLDAAEISRRLSRQPWWTPGLAVDPTTIEHAWIIFNAHAPGCGGRDGSVPGRDCGCMWKPWILYHWHEAHQDDPDSVPVTFALLREPDLSTDFQPVPASSAEVA